MHFKIHGMDCAEEIAILKLEVGPVVGGEEYLSFDLLNGRMTILSGPEAPALEAILQAIARTGMQAEVWQEGSETPSEAQGWQHYGRAILTGVSGLFLVVGFLLHTWKAGGIGEALGAEGLEHRVPSAAAICYALGILAGAWLILPKAWLAARRLRPDMNLLMTVAILGAIGAGTAKGIAQETGVDEVHAELLPEDKVAVIESLVAQHGRVAMVGDGVNDAPAMARATLGIAMGAAGSDAAIETADIALMSDDLAKLPWLIRHSRRTLDIIHQNIAFSLSVKLLFVALTFMGHASLWAAIGADMGASLLVIFNGLRLLRADAA